MNWALAGLERLTVDNGNRFTRLASAEEAIITMRDLASPVAAFVRERCEVGADKDAEVDQLYAAYKMWCEDNEHPKASKHVFGRDLRAAVPGVRKVRPATEASAVTSMLASHCRTPRKDRKPKTGKTGRS